MPGQLRPHYQRPLKGRLSAATRARMSANASGANNPFAGRTHSAATLAKMSASHKGTPRPTVKGKPRSADVRARIAAALKGRKRSRAHVAALRAAAKRGPFNPKYGEPRPDAVCKKISKALKGKPKSPLHLRHLRDAQTRRWRRVRSEGLRGFRGLARPPGKEVLPRERKEIVGTALKALRGLQREVVVGVFLEGQPIAEVATRLRIDLAVARNALTGASAALRRNQRLRALLE